MRLKDWFLIILTVAIIVGTAVSCIIITVEAIEKYNDGKCLCGGEWELFEASRYFLYYKCENCKDIMKSTICFEK